MELNSISLSVTEKFKFIDSKLKKPLFLNFNKMRQNSTINTISRLNFTVLFVFLHIDTLKREKYPLFLCACVCASAYLFGFDKKFMLSFQLLSQKVSKGKCFMHLCNLCLSHSHTNHSALSLSTLPAAGIKRSSCFHSDAVGGCVHKPCVCAMRCDPI
jgi:hypothetical protein